MEQPRRIRKARWVDSAGIFTPLELQVIALAAGVPGECTTCGPASRLQPLLSPFRKWLALPTKNRLANDRLEALRKLACATFATNGRPKPQVVAAAMEAGLSPRHVEQLGKWAERVAS